MARRVRRIRRVLAGAGVLLLLGGLVLLYGCTTTIIPPADLARPVSVYILDYGRHSSIILPRSEDVLVEYTYGEWDWYALDRTGILDVFRALIAPTRATLGRREIAWIDEWWEAIAHLNLYHFYVEQDDAEGLLRELDDRWEANRETHLFNERYGLHFVHDPERYHIFNNSNMIVARWLRDVGCEVRGWAIVSEWYVREQTSEHPDVDTSRAEQSRASTAEIAENAKER